MQKIFKIISAIFNLEKHFFDNFMRSSVSSSHVVTTTLVAAATSTYVHSDGQLKPAF